MRIFFASAHAAFCLGGAWFTECHSLPRRRTWQHGAQALLPAASEEWESTLTQVLVETGRLGVDRLGHLHGVVPRSAREPKAIAHLTVFEKDRMDPATATVGDQLAA